MNKEEIEKLRKTIPYGIGCYETMSEEQKRLDKELSLREMINSVWCYGGNCYDSEYINDYFKEDKIWHTYTLTKENVFEIVDNQLDYLNKHCKILHNVYEDNEGCTYNSIIEVN